MKAFISWSGGKEASLSYYKAMKSGSFEVACFLNMSSEDGKSSRTHGLSSDLLRLQADHAGVSLWQQRASWNTYEEEFKKVLRELKKEGIDSGVFGDIDLAEHREWVERVCCESGIKAHLPLWGMKRVALLEEFVNSGFEAIIVATRADLMGPEWLGRKIDKRFIKEVKSLGTVDLCGEKGEYHTLVTNGPIFKVPMAVTGKRKTKKGDHWFLKIKEAK